MKLSPGASSGGPEANAIQSLYGQQCTYWETGEAGSLSVGDLTSKCGGPAMVLEVSVSVGTAPAGSSLVVDALVSVDGVQPYQSIIGPGGLAIPAGSTTADLTPVANPNLPSGGLLKFTIVSVGSSVAGSDLRIGVVLGPF
jgi:hypothetical protein